jgi:hypothetical protein
MIVSDDEPCVRAGQPISKSFGTLPKAFRMTAGSLSVFGLPRREKATDPAFALSRTISLARRIASRRIRLLAQGQSYEFPTFVNEIAK